ncbi:uncharacterized protein LOC117930853 [Vitis riparia]|uniref:uncharacterized protein LOC117930853 n=1 Tax=Vitis riparia TaxID=96939 RepID=UPI00155B06DB|nr:uncharacterized protein LOC117930853 [Vitis riparia]
MDQRHNHLESLGICYRLFNFISKTLESQALKLMILCRPLSHGLAICHRLFNFTMQTLAAQAVKPVILGQPGHQPLGQVPISDASAPIATITSPRSVLNKGYKELPIGPGTAAQPQEKGLKKSVSINDTVEEIPNTSKSRKKKMAPEKLVSLEREKGEEPKPLKSILKVGSNLTGKSVSFTIPPIDAKMDEAQR